MDINELLKPYKRKIVAEAIVKALLLGLVVGLAVTAVSLGGIAIFKAIFDFFNARFLLITDPTIALIVRLVSGAAGILVSSIFGLVVALVIGVISFLIFLKKTILK